ncbi:heterokaryon incompatibility protein-domain-containing protein [Xylaria castorea]|nr:heterokaryon incompatibility protein-domain-containing protein [Xylaria castorea]
MRLINTTSFELKEFIGDPTNPRFPRYAILSHTWEQEEVSFQDIQNLDVAEKKAGFSKIAKCCEAAVDEGLNWAWVDTCCINKSDNAELTEAINSMFKWYEAATICYAYLSDVGDAGIGKHCEWRDSRWFTRGWTLQELVAPFEVIVYDCTWKQLGTKRLLTKELEEKTGIPAEVLLYPVARRKHSVAARMSWAKGRQTTRIEDRAYSLLGFFDIVNMPLVYGEGQKSFSRLHQIIIDTQPDETIFLGGLACLDHELSELSTATRAMYGQGFLITPDNVPTQLPATVRAFRGTAETPQNISQHMLELRTAMDNTAISERKDPRLRGDVLSMPMRIAQVFFSGYGPPRIPITMKKSTQVELNPASRNILEDFDMYGVKAMGGSLCLGMLRCGTTDDKILARYYLCSLATNNELWTYPMGVYRYVTPAEVHHWPDMQCHILLDENAWKPYPLLESLRDVTGWGSETQSSGTFNNGWSWEARTTDNTENFTNDPDAGLIKRNTHYYQLCFSSTGQVWDVTISLGANNISKEQGSNNVEVEINLQRRTAPELDARTVKLKHSGREGPVTELSHRLPVSRGTAELLISIHYGADAGTDYYSPMMRFRAFKAGDNE